MLRETLTSNITDDTVQLEFQKADGTYIQLFLDFKKEVQIYKLMVLPEEELQVSSWHILIIFVSNPLIVIIYFLLQMPSSGAAGHHHQSSSSFLGQHYQTICFAMKLSKQDFIAADAIAKLRQVNISQQTHFSL